MREIDALPQSRFTKRLTELSIEKEAGWRSKLVGLTAALGGAAVAGTAAAGLGYTAATEAGKQATSREKLLEELRKKLGEAPPTTYGEEGMKKAMKLMGKRWQFDPGGGIYRGARGALIGNGAYNRRLGAMARRFSNSTPQGYASRIRDWQKKKTGDVEGLLKRYEAASESPWKKPSFYAGIPKKFYNSVFGE